MKRTLALSATALTAGAVLALAAPMAASAHVSASSDSTAAGSYAIVTFSVPHGCEASPTTGITISIPDSILSVTPTVNPSWSVEKVITEVPEGTEDASGNAITERVGEIVYTSTTGGLPDGLRDSFELSVRLPDGEVGDVVEFPVLQECVEGSVEWIGDDVPAVVLTAAEEGDGHGHGEAENTEGHEEGHSEETAAENTAVEVQSADVLARVLGVLGLVVGVIGVTIAVVSRRRAS